MKSKTISFEVLTKYQYDLNEKKQNLRTLQTLCKNGIIEPEVLQMQQSNMEESLRKAIEEIHKAKISYREESAGKGRPPRRVYVTQFKDPASGKAVKVKGKDLDEVYEKLAKVYSLAGSPAEQDEVPDAPAEKSLAAIASSWAEYRKGLVVGGTVDKDLWAWHKYYQDDPITFKPITDLSLAEIKTWLAGQIQKHGLTRRQFWELKGVWNSIEQYAMEADIIKPEEGKIRHARGFRGYKPTVKKPDEMQIYTKEEKELLISACMRYYHMHKNSSYLACILALFFGVRVGEAVCLKYDDFDWDTEWLTISEMERQDVDINSEDLTTSRGGYSVINLLKKDWESRSMPIPTGARVVVDFIKAEQEKQNIVSDYLFTRTDGERRHKEDITKALHRVCAATGIPDKTGLHEARRTYASDLIESGEFSDREIMAFMGHRDFGTTQKYYNRSARKKSVTTSKAVTDAVGIPLPVLWSNVG